VILLEHYFELVNTAIFFKNKTGLVIERDKMQDIEEEDAQRQHTKHKQDAENQHKAGLQVFALHA
jgi:hypothetical protein